MLRWRLPLGSCLIALLAGLFWLDNRAPIPGVALVPVLVVFVLWGTGELLGLAAAGGLLPGRLAVYAGNGAIVLAPWLAGLFFPAGAGGGSGAAPRAAAVILALALALALVWSLEMGRFRRPGGETARVAAAVFALVYLGFLPSFLVLIRLQWGIGALASLLIVVKVGDSGAYAAGRLWGSRQMAPRLSPGKTIEGAAGGLVAACAASAGCFLWLMPAVSGGGPVAGGWGRWVLFGLLVGGAGVLGDLAESHLKRDAQRKDSSRWMPGFGGCLDLLDSVLLAGPVAYACWHFGLVG